METFEGGAATGIEPSEHEDAGVSRRHLLGIAGSNFALAASGLLLPAWLQRQDAEARKSAAHGKLGGRRGKNRRGRDAAKRRQRAKAREKLRDQAKAPGWSLNKYVSFSFAPSHSLLQDVHIDTYFRIKGSGEHWSSLQHAQTFTGADTTRTYAPERYDIAAFIQARGITPIYIEVRNPLIGTPWATIARGGRIDGSGNYVDGDANWGIKHVYRYSQYPLDVDKRMTVGLTPGTDWVEYLASVTRADDTDTHKVFAVSLSHASREYDYCDLNVACWV